MNIADFSLDKFSTEIPAKCITIPQERIKSSLDDLKSLLLNLTKQNCIIQSDKPGFKSILLAPDAEIPSSYSSFEVTEMKVKKTYLNYTYVEAMKILLPENMTIPTGFETIGHIAHFNLTHEQFPYRYLVGKVLIDKTPNIKTVVCKISKIDNVFRTFKMEIVAGNPDCYTIVNEGSCRFGFNFQEVYWNSKLSRERDRVLANIDPKDVICDAFAGVGPFAIRAAKKGCRVIANDLNPSSYKYLIQNSTRNKIKTHVAIFNLDAREFLKKFLQTPRQAPPTEDLSQIQDFSYLPCTFDHLYMNLPMDAIEFLDVLQGSFDRNTWTKLPTVHVYGFAGESNSGHILIDRLVQIWGLFDTSCIKITQVRDVSPRKFMYCLEFIVPESIAFTDGKNIRAELQDFPIKKQKLDEQE